MIAVSVLQIQCDAKGCPDKFVAKKPSNYVTLIIDKCPNYSSVRDPIKKGRKSSSDEGYEIAYLDDSLVFHSYKTNKAPTRDTIVFPIYSDIIEIEHIYRLYEKLSFLFHRGDSVLFTYEADYPKATVLNREANDLEINYEWHRRKKIFGDSLFFWDGIASYSGVKSRYWLTPRSVAKTNEWQQTKRQSYQSALDRSETEWQKEQLFLDSLALVNAMSGYHKDFYESKTKLRLAHLLSIARENQSISVGEEDLDFDDWYSFRDSTDLTKPIRFSFYRRVLEKDYKTRVRAKAPYISGVNLRYRDARILFDSLMKGKEYSAEDNTYLLTNELENIIKHFTSTNISHYLKKYWSIVDNDTLKSHILRKHRAMIPNTIYDKLIQTRATKQITYDGLNLRTEDFEEVSFQGLLNRQKGRIVYVDFWSSTCVPCIVSAPYMHQLAKDYEAKGVSFLFISLDKDSTRWSKGVEKVRLIGYEHNYRVDRSAENPFLTTFQVNEIPRYMLFDTNGTLIHSKAYDPKTKEIRVALDSLIMNRPEQISNNTNLSI